MKARVKATGEIVEVEVWIKHTADCQPICLYKGGDFFYKEESLDFENITEGLTDVKEKSLPKDEPDYWEKLKHQAAIAAMQGVLSSCKDIHNLSVGMASRLARAFANELIEKLKNEK